MRRLTAPVGVGAELVEDPLGGDVVLVRLRRGDRPPADVRLAPGEHLLPLALRDGVEVGHRIAVPHAGDRERGRDVVVDVVVGVDVEDVEGHARSIDAEGRDSPRGDGIGTKS